MFAYIYKWLKKTVLNHRSTAAGEDVDDTFTLPDRVEQLQHTEHDLCVCVCVLTYRGVKQYKHSFSTAELFPCAEL
jgi:hypothetical protein